MVYGVYIYPGKVWYCRVYPCINFTCFLCSTLLVVAMTFDRFYSIIAPHKAASFNTVKRAKVTIMCIAIASIVYNIPHLFLTSNVNWECIPYGHARGKPLGEFYYWFSLIIHFTLPFVLLLGMNSFIIHKLRTRVIVNQEITQDRNSIQCEASTFKTKNTELQVFAILLLVSFSFLVLTTPAYMFFLFIMFFDFFKTPRLFAGYYLFYNVAYKMQLTNYGINFYLYVISGGKFRTDLRNLFRCFNRHEE